MPKIKFICQTWCTINILFSWKYQLCFTKHICSFQKLTGTGPTWPLQATPTHVATQPAGRSPTSRFRETSWRRNYKRKETFFFSIMKNQAQKRKNWDIAPQERNNGGVGGYFSLVFSRATDKWCGGDRNDQHATHALPSNEVFPSHSWQTILIPWKVKDSMTSWIWSVLGGMCSRMFSICFFYFWRMISLFCKFCLFKFLSRPAKQFSLSQFANLTEIG